jgi:hypothetical protein
MLGLPVIVIIAVLVLLVGWKLFFAKKEDADVEEIVKSLNKASAKAWGESVPADESDSDSDSDLD